MFQPVREKKTFPFKMSIRFCSQDSAILNKELLGPLAKKDNVFSLGGSPGKRSSAEKLVPCEPSGRSGEAPREQSQMLSFPRAKWSFPQHPQGMVWSPAADRIPRES